MFKSACTMVLAPTAVWVPAALLFEYVGRIGRSQDPTWLFGALETLDQEYRTSIVSSENGIIQWCPTLPRFKCLKDFTPKYRKHAEDIKELLAWEKRQASKRHGLCKRKRNDEESNYQYDTGVIFLHIMRALLDQRKKIMLSSAKITNEVEPGRLRYEAVHNFCFKFLDLQEDIEEFWTEGWQDVIRDERYRGSSIDEEMN
ncbi:hypothetical protein BDZ45DRAFT_432906 [Acephala macrosclerotiorum]|nr:hypothetical protein BDZ45DRAFT_432906 [Acephala macrosclerotiorum]